MNHSRTRSERVGSHPHDGYSKGEELYKKGEELYKTVFEHSNDAIFVLDPAGDCIVDANPKASSMLGYTREELLSLPISAIHPDEMPILKAFAQSVLDDGKGWTNEVGCQTKDGNYIPAEISASSIDVVGGKLIIAMVRDMTERHQAQAAERELALVEERNRIAREIHDSLAQGLTAIIWQINASELLVKAGGSQALDSLDQIRELARESLQEARRSVWDLRSGPLKGVSLVQALEQETAKAGGVNIRTAFNATGNERVLPGGVEAALLRICQEALANMLKHSSASRATVTVAFGHDKVNLRVSDNGIGFDPETHSQWDKERGGFGLTSMRERAQLLGGKLTVKSQFGRGTDVEAEIPAPQRAT